MITTSQILRLCPDARPDIAEAIAETYDWLDEVGVADTSKRLCHFLAQVAHESGGLRLMEENLRYSASRLCTVFPKRFPTLKSAAACAGNPEAVANAIYGGRMGNNTKGDGWRYRGRGLIQLTGKDNYTTYAERTGLPLVKQPELAALPENAVRIAAHFFIDHGCLALADKDDIAAITKRINGGRNGLAERQRLYTKARGIFPDALSPAHGGESTGKSTLQTIRDSGLAKVAIGGLVTSGSAVTVKTVVPEPPDLPPVADVVPILTPPVDGGGPGDAALQELTRMGHQATEAQQALEPMIALWRLISANLWPAATVILGGLCAVMLYRKLREGWEGRHIKAG